MEKKVGHGAGKPNQVVTRSRQQNKADLWFLPFHGPTTGKGRRRKAGELTIWEPILLTRPICSQRIDCRDRQSLAFFSILVVIAVFARIGRPKKGASCPKCPYNPPARSLLKQYRPHYRTRPLGPFHVSPHILQSRSSNPGASSRGSATPYPTHSISAISLTSIELRRAAEIILPLSAVWALAPVLLTADPINRGKRPNG